MSASVADFVFELVNVLVLAGALGWLLWKPVRRALDTERQRHASGEVEAATRRAEAERLVSEATTMRAEAERAGARGREEIIAGARAEVARIVEEARAHAVEQRSAVQHELEAARRASAEQLAGAVGEIAARSVRELLEKVSGPSLDDALIRAAGDRLRAMPSNGKAITIDAARPLLDEQRRSLAAAAGRDIHERVVTELGAGVRITTAVGQIDATAAGMARDAARQIAAMVAEADHA